MQLWKGATGVMAISLLLVAGAARAQDAGRPVAVLSVSAGSHTRVDTPIMVPLGALPGLAADLVLREVTGGLGEPVAHQVLAGDPPRLAFVLGGVTRPGAVRTFELRQVSHAPARVGTGSQASQDGESIHLTVDDRDVLAYRYTIEPAPEGENALLARGGFIHPMKTPAGFIITRTRPPDHWHHMGLWNPWTHTEFEGRSVDFWNIGEGQGSVRPNTVLERTSGPVLGGFRASLDHVDFTSGAEKAALREQWAVRAWSGVTTGAGPERRAANVIDFASTLAAASDSLLRIVAYRYQGLGLRASAEWSDDTSRILTSEGLTKANANATRARWILAEGLSDEKPGILMMGAPTNHDHPERLRIWPTGMNEGKENVFINFNPAQDEDWVIEPGRPETLRYRLITYDGGMNPDEAERLWNDWADPPSVTVRPTGLDGRRVLVYTHNGEGYVHDNIAASIAAIEQLGAENGFAVETSDDPSSFTPENLARFDALIFSNSNNDAFDTDDQRSALQSYVRAGGGFVGIHSASGSERSWPWFSALLGGNFVRHAPGQDFTAVVVDAGHPATAALPRRWDLTTDECYFLDELNPGIRTLLSADLSTVEDPQRDPFPGTLFAKGYPLAWYQSFDGGRQFYTSLGHPISRYSEPLFLRHILGGIQWVINGDQ